MVPGNVDGGRLCAWPLREEASVSIRFGMLGLLDEKPDHGYELRRRFETRVGKVWGLNLGQVYQTLKSLDRDGLIRPVGIPPDEVQDGAPPRKRFELTEKGEKVLQSWLRKPPSSPRPIRAELLVRLLLLQPGRPDEAVRRIESQAKVYRRHLSRLRARERSLSDGKQGSTLGAALGIDAAVLHAEAHLKWLENCRIRILDAAEADAGGDRREED